MVEAPVQDRARVQELELLEVAHFDAPAAQAEHAGGLHQGEGVGAEAAEPDRLPHLVEPQLLAVEAEDHGQAGGAAVGAGGLLDERDLAAAAEPQVAQRREAGGERRSLLRCFGGFRHRR
jgi:hypothetical protein